MAEAKSEREAAVKQRDRLVRMTDDKNEFVAKLQQARMSVYKVRQQATVGVHVRLQGNVAKLHVHQARTVCPFRV